MTFTRDAVEGMLPPTFQIKHRWWEPQGRRIVSEVTEANSFLALTPIEKKVRDTTETEEGTSLCLVSLVPLNPTPFLSLTAT